MATGWLEILRGCSGRQENDCDKRIYTACTQRSDEGHAVKGPLLVPPFPRSICYTWLSKAT
eukprot:4019730-Pleurochrysis_carterae.AAC.1